MNLKVCYLTISIQIKVLRNRRLFGVLLGTGGRALAATTSTRVHVSAGTTGLLVWSLLLTSSTLLAARRVLVQTVIKGASGNFLEIVEVV